MMGGRKKRVVREFRMCCAEIVRNVVQYFEREKKAKGFLLSLNRARDRAVLATGISRTALFDLNDRDAELLQPGEREHRMGSSHLDEDDFSRIRPAIVDLVLEKQVLTLDSILLRLRQAPEGWKWSRSTLYRALHSIGFRYTSRKHGYYERLREDEENVLRRAHYLKFFFDYERDGRPFVYLDESWINQNLTSSRLWTDGGKDCEDEVPPGKGPRWILLAAGSKECGWIPATWKMWKGNIKSEEYHTEMNAEVFAHWFNNFLLPSVPRNSVIVLDRAPYHKLLTPESKCAKTTFTKAQIVDWLIAHHASDEEGNALTRERLLEEPFILPADGERMHPRVQRGWTKQALLAKATEIRPSPQFLAQRWIWDYNSANSADIKVLFLPVAHPQLNPIETMWSQIKQYVRQHNHEWDMEKVRGLAMRKRDLQQADDWAASYGHMRKYAIKQWEADELLLQAAENVQEDSESDGEVDDEL